MVPPLDDITKLAILFAIVAVHLIVWTRFKPTVLAKLRGRQRVQ
jgi:hypothetical protein